MQSKEPTVDELVAGWVAHFDSADRELSWLAVEREVTMPLVDGVTLAGRVDAIGDDWFADWKTASRYKVGNWRDEWRFNAQSLTYGVLLRHLNIRRFTVRMAFKTSPPSFDHEWYVYTDGELDAWQEQLCRMANEIQAATISGCSSGRSMPNQHWQMNPLSCLRYGAKYACPFLLACSRQQWNEPILGLVAREPHLDAERDPSQGMILNATRVDDWLACQEKFRRTYIRNEVQPAGDALRLGSAFHEKLAAHYTWSRLGRPTPALGMEATNG